MDLLREFLFVQDVYVQEKLKEHNDDKRYHELVSFFVVLKLFLIKISIA